MKFETFKKLVESEFTRTNDLSLIKEKIRQLLNLYESDCEQDKVDENCNLIPYHHLCGCNPINGGSGVCGCGIGNILVKSEYKKEIYESVRREREKYKSKI